MKTKSDVLDGKVAILFVQGKNKSHYDSHVIAENTTGCAQSICGVIWLKRPSEGLRLSVLSCLLPGGFEECIE